MTGLVERVARAIQSTGQNMTWAPAYKPSVELQVVAMSALRAIRETHAIVPLEPTEQHGVLFWEWWDQDGGILEWKALYRAWLAAARDPLTPE
jgi:hypothetical protein